MGSQLNKHESKYFNTALYMNEALIRMLDKKEYEYITVKDICNTAGVSRSTFYLHYESMDDLLLDCLQNMFKQLQDKFKSFEIEKLLKDNKLDALKLFTPEYSIPYLKFIKDNKKAFVAAFKHQELFKVKYTFDRLYEGLFEPIMAKFNIPNNEKKFAINYYMSGIHGIITEWIKNCCNEETEFIASLIMKYVCK